MTERSFSRTMTGGMSTSGYTTLSRSSQVTAGPPKSQATVLKCNLCHKPLKTSLFVTTCDCLFCEDCVYSHFNNSSDCPTCTRRLGESDFMQLSVTDAPPNKGSSSRQDLTSLFQSVFTKGVESQGGPYVQYMDACQAAIRAQQHASKLSRFLYKQFFLASQSTSASSGRLQQEYDALEHKFTQYQQSSKAELIQAQHNAQLNEDRIQSLQRELKTMQDKYYQLETQLPQDPDRHVMQAPRPLPPHHRHRGGRSVSGSAGHSDGGVAGSISVASGRHLYPVGVVNRNRDRPPQYIDDRSNGSMGVGGGALGHPTPIQINPSASFASSTATSHGHAVRPLNGAPPIRQVHNQGYSFSRGHRSASHGSGTTNSSNNVFRNSSNNAYTKHRSHKQFAKYKTSTRQHYR